MSNTTTITSTTTAMSPMVTPSGSEIEKCLTLLQEGEKVVTIGQKDVVVVLGMTGSGKTTLIKFLINNIKDNLLAEEVGDNVGEFIITDKENKISKNTVISHTIFPELNIDPETQIAFYDGPGFGDTRGMSVDIAGTYFMHKVITGSEKIKFILTVNYSSVRYGIDRGDFLELMIHLLHLVKNIDKYMDSIGLVVTKVENHMIKKGNAVVLVTDNNIIEYIVKFLTEFRNNISQVAQGDLATNMTKVVDIFLRKNNMAYEKIALFRRPDEAGPITDIKLLQDGKKSVMKMIVENLKHVATNKEDFGYVISEQSKNQLIEVITKINQNITTQIAEVCNTKIAAYEIKIVQLTDVYEIYEILQKDIENLHNWLFNLPSNQTLTDFTNMLFTLGQSMLVPFTEADMKQILKQSQYLPFLETIQGSKSVHSIITWKTGLQPYTNYLKETMRWYKFLTNLHTALSKYEVQNKIDDFANMLEHSIVGLNDAEFVSLIKFCKGVDKSLHLDDYETLEVDAGKLETLNRILESTLKYEKKIIWDPNFDIYEVHGSYVKLSDIVAKNSILKAKYVNIFAAEKIFIDANVTRSNENFYGLSLVAPIWEIIGDIHINMNGAHGPQNVGQAKNGNWLTKNGENGRPGIAGKSAGHFFGLVNHIINGEQLKITANGGQGGDGEDGGDGANGQDGDSPIIEENGNCYSNGIDRFYNYQLGGFFRRVYCVYGEHGGNGGNGGDGGAQGLGGFGGNIKLVKLNQSSHIQYQAITGFSGHMGKGGFRGQGGKAGKSWNHQKMMWWWRAPLCSRSRRLADEYGDCADTDFVRNGKYGIDGIAGANKFGLQTPNIVPNIDFSMVIEEYKAFLTEKINEDNVSRHSKILFLNGINLWPFAHSDQYIDTSDSSSKQQKINLNGRRSKRYLLHYELDQKGIRDCFHETQWPVIGNIENEPFEQHTNSILRTNLAQFSFTDALILVDLLLKGLTKSKPIYLQNCAIDYEQAHYCAAELLLEFEKIMQTLGDSVKIMDYNPVDIMEKIEMAIIAGKYEHIGKIMFDLIDGQSVRQKTEILNQLQNLLHQD